MPDTRIANTAACLGRNFSAQRTITTGPESAVADPTFGVAKIGQLTTRTDSNTGILTMAASHGITTAARLDVYWSGGARYGMTVGTVSINTVPIDLGGGDNLPDVNTAVTAMIPTQHAFAMEAAALQSLMVGCNSPAWAVFLAANAAVSAAVYVTSGEHSIWDVDSGVSVPFAYDTATVYMSHGNSSLSRQVTAIATSS